MGVKNLTKTIELTQGKVAIVDIGDYEYLNQWKWHAVYKGSGKYYACRKQMVAYDRVTKKVTSKTIYLHRLLLGEPTGLEVDHINSNSLDNRRENLRVCSHKENLQNSRVRSDSTSGHKGVTWDKRLKKWFVRCTADGFNHHVGYFASLEDAARAYDVAALKYHGQYARVNNE